MPLWTVRQPPPCCRPPAWLLPAAAPRLPPQPRQRPSSQCCPQSLQRGSSRTMRLATTAQAAASMCKCWCPAPPAARAAPINSPAGSHRALLQHRLPVLLPELCRRGIDVLLGVALQERTLQLTAIHRQGSAGPCPRLATDPACQDNFGFSFSYNQLSIMIAPSLSTNPFGTLLGAQSSSSVWLGSALIRHHSGT